MLRNSKIIVKSFAPLVLMMIMATGLMTYAIMSLDRLAEQTHEVVDVQVVRLENMMSLRLNVSEASNRARDLILETREQERATHRNRYDAAVKASFEAADALKALAVTPERKAANQKLQNLIKGFYSTIDRANALSLQNDRDAARAILLHDSTEVRTALLDTIQAGIDRLATEFRRARDEADRAVVKSKTVLIGTSVAGLLVAGALSAVIVVFGIIRPLGNLV